MIKAVEAAIKLKNSNKGRKMVINMSLSGGKNNAMNDALDNAKRAGIVVVVAAGNDSKDACKFSPASSNGITAGSLDQNGENSSFSNTGK